MSRIRIISSAAIVAFALCLAASHSRAQESSKPSAEAQEKPINAYRLDFSVNELEDGKKINSRQYSMNLNSGDTNQIRIGTRVPVEAKQGEFTYLDVGTTIKSRLRERDNGLMLDVWCDVSNFALSDQQNQSPHPALRQLQINASTMVLPGKPMMVGSVDDPNSKRQFQLEVTVNRLK
jgi:3D (Asp-Asp-Asp) domain-containing protein